MNLAYLIVKQDNYFNQREHSKNKYIRVGIEKIKKKYSGGFLGEQLYTFGIQNISKLGKKIIKNY